jgi:hypothetical protein
MLIHTSVHVVMRYPASIGSANIEFNVSAHGEHIRERKAPTENSNSFYIDNRLLLLIQVIPFFRLSDIINRILLVCEREIGGGGGLLEYN